MKPEVMFIRGLWRPFLTAAAAAGTAATALGFLGGQHWFLDLFSHFRPSYAVAFLFLAAASGIAKCKLPFALSVLGVAVNGYLVTPLFDAVQPQPVPGARPLRVMHFNIHAPHSRIEDVLAHVIAARADVAVLLEIDDEWVRHLRVLPPPYQLIAAEPRNDASGLAAISRVPIDHARIVQHGGAISPDVELELSWDGADLLVIGSHVWPPIRPDWAEHHLIHLEKLADRIRRSDRAAILVGDLNTSIWSARYQDLVQRAGLLDAQLGRGFQPTWPSHNPLLSIAIDQSFHTPELTSIERTVGPSFGSDHYSVTVTLARAPAPDRARSSAQSASWSPDPRRTPGSPPQVGSSSPNSAR